MTERIVDAIADRYVDEYAALDPITAPFIGVDGHADRLTDLSPDGFAAREELTRTALADATAATPVDEREAVARDSFLERLGLEVELIDAGLAAIPETLRGYRTTLAEEADKGNVSAVRQYREVIDQIATWTGRSGEGGDMVGSLVAGASTSAASASSRCSGRSPESVVEVRAKRVSKP